MDVVYLVHSLRKETQLYKYGLCTGPLSAKRHCISAYFSSLLFRQMGLPKVFFPLEKVLISFAGKGPPNFLLDFLCPSSQTLMVIPLIVIPNYNED